RLPLVGPEAQSKDGPGGSTRPCSSASFAMSSGRLFLDRDARQQSPSPLHRHPEHKAIDGSEERIYHRTVTSALTGCLTSGGHPTPIGIRQGRCFLMRSICCSST